MCRVLDLQTLEKRGIHVKRILGDTSQAEVEAVAHFPAEVDNWEDNSTSQTLPKAKVEMDAITLPEKKRDPDILPINSLPSKSATPGGSDATASISNYPQKVPHATSAESSARYAQLRAKLLARNSWANDHSLQLCHDITPEILHQSLAGYIQQAEKRLEYEEEALGLLGVHPVVNATLGPFGATLARDAGFQIGEAAKESSKMMTVNDIIPPILHRSYQLEYYATSSLGQKIYLEQEGSAKSNNEFSRQLQASFNDFGKILGKIAEVFGLKAAHCRMFVIPSLNGTGMVELLSLTPRQSICKKRELQGIITTRYCH